MKYAVCIPTIGRKAELFQTLEAVAAQDPAPGLVVVIDQNEDVKFLAGKLPGACSVTFVPEGRPRTDPAGSNVGLDLALSFGYEAVIKWDDDLVPAQGCFAALLATLEAFPDAAAVGGMYPRVGETRPARMEGGAVVVPDGAPNHLQLFPWDGPATLFEVHHLYSSFAYRPGRAAVVGGFCEDYSAVAHRHETDFTIRLNEVGGLIVDTSAVAAHLLCEEGGTRRVSPSVRRRMVSEDEALFQRRMKMMGLTWNFRIEAI